MQVVVAWIKLTNYDLSSFPQSIQKLRDDLRAVVRNLKAHYPNVKLGNYIYFPLVSSTGN